MSEEEITFQLWPWSVVTDVNETDFQPCYTEHPETLRFFGFIVYGLLINVIGLLGIVGNVISMIILSRPQMRSSINYLLIGLARIDTLLIVTSVLLFGLPSIYPYTGLLFTYYYVVLPHIIPVVYPLATMTQTASAYLTLTISLERFVAVCYPLKAKSLCTYGRARIYVMAIVIFSVVYNVPRLFEGTVQKEWSDRFNTTIYCARETSLRANYQYIRIYVHWLYLICMYLIPFSGLAVLNGCIYKQVLRANKERQRLSRIQKREIGLATMLLCVVAVFFVCNLFPLVINTIETFQVPLDFNLQYLIHVSNLLVTVNSSVNFIIYVTFGEKFQRLFLVLFCHNSLLGMGRESPEQTTNDEVTYVSMADRQSTRRLRQSLSRNGTLTASHYHGGNSRNGSTLLPNQHHHHRGANGSLGEPLRASTRSRTSSPAPCVYYPANRGGGYANGKDNNVTLL